ncbi:hypothetical protein C4564_01945 [Candidatus Microgenomates bacterium]|nr:MAG: hypothetical protein C4564_01945 [Candidatus Microgenomates bacterium]
MFTALLVGTLLLAQGTDATTSVQNRVEQRIENRVEVRTNVQEVLQEAREARVEARENLRLQLTQIKDERKQQIVESAMERIQSMNDRWVAHWENVLERLAGILDKVEIRADESSLSATDKLSIEALISSARDAIAAASMSVNTQASKVYNIEITDESTLGSNMKAVMAQLRDDTRNVIEDINVARKAVAEVLSALKSMLPTLSS